MNISALIFQYELVSHLDANANELNAALTILELESLIKRLPGIDTFAPI
ncbi:MAG: hypothetical protein K2X81_03630 [Candidatus Obscuribacterales bacterium]|nr:hypothetical protein [Candidatus Obscuribacterales bacterium]